MKLRILPLALLPLVSLLAAGALPVPATIPGHSTMIWSLAFSPDGRTLASAALDPCVKLWEVSTHKVRASLQVDDRVALLSFSPDGTTLAVAGCYVTLWDIKTGQATFRIKDCDAWPPGVAFSPDGRMLATCGTFPDHAIRVWDARSAILKTSLRGHTESVYRLAFAPTGETLASGAFDGTIRLWDLRTGKVLRTFKGPEAVATPFEFSPDGAWLACGGWDGPAWVCALPSGQTKFRFPWRRGVNSLTFTPDGTHLVMGQNDNTIMVWDLASGKPQLCLQYPAEYPASLLIVAMSPAGDVLAAGGGEDARGGGDANKHNDLLLWNVRASLIPGKQPITARSRLSSFPYRRPPSFQPRMTDGDSP